MGIVRNIGVVVCGAGAVLGLVSQAVAGFVVVDDTQQTSDWNGPVNYNEWIAQSFTTGTTGGNIDYVQALLSPVSGTDIGGSFHAAIYSSLGKDGAVGMPLDNGQLSMGLLTAGQSLRTFRPVTSISLSADTTYFFVLGQAVENGARLDWWGPSAPTVPYATSDNGGYISTTNTYGLYDMASPASGWTMYDGAPQTLVVAVPEPTFVGTVAAMAISGLSLRNRRRVRAA